MIVCVAQMVVSRVTTQPRLTARVATRLHNQAIARTPSAATFYTGTARVPARGVSRSLKPGDYSNHSVDDLTRNSATHRQNFKFVSSCFLLAYLKIANFPFHPLHIIVEGDTGMQEQNKQLQANRAGTLNCTTGYRPGSHSLN